MKEDFNKLYYKRDLIMEKLRNDLMSQIESAAIEGLKRKGFEFENRYELEEFVKNRCTCEHNIDLREKVYYVDDIPFLLHKYESTINLPISVTDRSPRISASLGHYAYL